jgi:IclR helix-turn-helix domain
MTRYRKKTLRLLEQFLEESGPLRLEQISEQFGMDKRPLRNYLQRHREVFEVVGVAPQARWRTVRSSVSRE